MSQNCKCSEAQETFAQNMFNIIERLKADTEPCVLNIIVRKLHTIFSPNVCTIIEQFIGSIIRHQLTGEPINNTEYDFFEKSMTELDRNPLLYKVVSNCFTQNAQRQMEQTIGQEIRKSLLLK